MTEAELGAPTIAAAAGDSRRLRDEAWPAAAGVLAVAVMLGMSELLAALLPNGRSHVVALGDEIIDRTPGWLERAVIANLGTADKPFLIANILAVSALLGAALGVLGARRFVLGAGGIAAMAAVGTAASLADPQAGPGASIAAGVVGAFAGIVTLRMLLDAALPGGLGSVDSPRRPARRCVRSTAAASCGSRAAPSPSRRSAPSSRGGSRAASGSSGSGRASGCPGRVGPRRLRLQARGLAIAGLTPLYVPNGAFYRIDTALTVPQDRPGRVVARAPRQGRPPVQRHLRRAARDAADRGRRDARVRLERGRRRPRRQRTLAGRPAPPLLERAGAHNDATQIVGRSVDGFTAGFPDARAIDGRRGDGRGRDERRAAAARARLPGAARGARPLRLRLRHEVARVDRAATASTSSTATGSRAAGRSTARSRRSRASTSRDAQSRPAGRRSRASRGRRPAASSASRCRSTTARGRRRRSPTRSTSTRGGSGTSLGRDSRASTRSPCERPTAREGTPPRAPTASTVCAWSYSAAVTRSGPRVPVRSESRCRRQCLHPGPECRRTCACGSTATCCGGARRWRGPRALADADGVVNDGVRDVDDAKAGVVDALAEVDVLAEQEEPFIPAANTIEDGARNMNAAPLTQSTSCVAARSKPVMR